MAASEANSTVQIPLIAAAAADGDQTQNSPLNRSLHTLESFLAFFGFRQLSPLSTSLSWLLFSLVGVVAPFLLIGIGSFSEEYEIMAFDLEILFSHAIVASISLFFISQNLRKYGLEKLLFIHRCSSGHLAQFHQLYIHHIHEFFRFLLLWFGVCLVLKTARVITRVIYLYNGPWWISAAIVLGSLVPWAYSTIVFLSGTALFCLVGKLQVIHLENYGKLLERDLDVMVYIQEHMRLAYCLSEISHMFRGFLVLEFLVITGCQIASLFITLGNKGIINFINAGDFAVLLIVQLVGILSCLSTAASISHRAQGLGSVVCQWHALVTCNSNNNNNDASSQSGILTNGGNPEAVNAVGSSATSFSEIDLESSDSMPLPTNHAQFSSLTSSSSSYNERMAFVAYVHSNTGGFTIFGFVIDRMFINTLFFIELSLVFFVLGKTITVTLR